jgi:hypothetical protein
MMATMTMATAGCRSAPQAKPSADALLSLDLVLDAPAARPLLFVDERLVPLSPRRAAQKQPPITLRVTHGAHRIEARAEGHFPAYADVSIPADRSLRLRLRLDPDADLDADRAPREDAVRERLVP